MAHVYVVWSNENGGWWRPKKAGYTPDVWKAGRYTLAQAQSCESRHPGRGCDVIVAAPESGRMLALFSVYELTTMEEAMRQRAAEATRVMLGLPPDPGGEAAREAPPNDLRDLS